MSSDSDLIGSRRRALKCMAFGFAGTLFTLTGGVLTPVEIARAGERSRAASSSAIPLFVQLSDTHIGFNKDANPDPGASLERAIELVNSLPTAPALILHTGDITHLAKPAEFDAARQILSGLKVTELHTVPGEHDLADASQSEYFSRFGQSSGNKGYYSFDSHGVHFVALNNVMQFKPGGLGSLGAQQLEWLAADLRNRSASTPIVLFAHMPLWTIYEPWGWGTEDGAQALELVRRFGSVTVLNGHIHQIRGFAFNPASIVVHPGTTVVWKNLDDEPHSVVGDTRRFRSGALDTGESFSYTFDAAGTYQFVCSLHPHMTGVVRVQ
jgi:plastocyanin